jgi:hypothetical protein
VIKREATKKKGPLSGTVVDSATNIEYHFGPDDVVMTDAVGTSGDKQKEQQPATQKHKAEPRFTFWAGDEVLFDVLKDSNTARAISVRLVRAAERPRFVGIVKMLTHDFGFLSTPSLDDDIFFLYNEFRDPGDWQRIHGRSTLSWMSTRLM